MAEPAAKPSKSKGFPYFEAIKIGIAVIALLVAAYIGYGRFYGYKGKNLLDLVQRRAVSTLNENIAKKPLMVEDKEGKETPYGLTATGVTFVEADDVAKLPDPLTFTVNFETSPPSKRGETYCEGTYDTQTKAMTLRLRVRRASRDIDAQWSLNSD